MKYSKKIMYDNEKKYNICYYVILITIGLLFFFILGEQGYVIEKDSNVHIRGDQWVMSYGYMVYPLFAHICKMIFASVYLDSMYVIQGILSLISSCFVAEYIRKTYGCSRKLGIIVFVLSFGPYTYTLPQYVASHGIMTESITFPLFNLWMICALQVFRSKRKKWFVMLFCLSAVMAFTRPQLLVLFVIDVLFLVDLNCIQRIGNITKNVLIKKMLVLMFSIFSFIIGICIFALFVKHAWYPQLTDAVAGRTLCLIQEEDEELFSGEMQQLVKIIYREVDEQKNREVYFRTDIKRWEDVCNATNNNTKMLGGLIVDNLDVFNCSPEKISSNKVKGEITYPLLVAHWSEYMEMTMELILQSLVVSVFVHPDWAYTLGYCIALFMYLVALLLLLVHKKVNFNLEYRMPMRTVLMVITSICFLTNVIFIGIQRYVVYPFGWFYIAFIIMFRSMIIGNTMEG